MTLGMDIRLHIHNIKRSDRHPNKSLLESLPRAVGADRSSVACRLKLAGPRFIAPSFL